MVGEEWNSQILVNLPDKNRFSLKHTIIDTLSHITNWLTANKLVLNFSKTNIINFAPKRSTNPLLEVSFDNIVISEVSELKFLGIQIDSNLNWKSHVEYIIPKLSSAVFVIRNLSYFMKSEAL